jgi:hypothetical protein
VDYSDVFKPANTPAYEISIKINLRPRTPLHGRTDFELKTTLLVNKVSVEHPFNKNQGWAGGCNGLLICHS